MYSKLMWCVVSLVINNLRPAHLRRASDIELEVLESNAKNNKYHYTFRLNGKLYVCEYVFATNLRVYGLVNVTAVDDGIKATFNVSHMADATTCSTSDSNFNEFYTCHDKCFIDLTITDKQVTDVSTMEAMRDKQHKGQNIFTLRHTTVSVADNGEMTSMFAKTLFAATAALDYDSTKCEDAIFIGKDNINIVLFEHDGRRVICLTNPCERLDNANMVKLINSEFKQIIQYNNPRSDTSTIEEYVLGEDNEAILRRKYNCKYNKANSQMIVDRKLKFSVQELGKSIYFIKEQ